MDSTRLHLPRCFSPLRVEHVGLRRSYQCAIRRPRLATTRLHQSRGCGPKSLRESSRRSTLPTARAHCLRRRDSGSRCECSRRDAAAWLAVVSVRVVVLEVVAAERTDGWASACALVEVVASTRRYCCQRWQRRLVEVVAALLLIHAARRGLAPQSLNEPYCVRSLLRRRRFPPND